VATAKKLSAAAEGELLDMKRNESTGQMRGQHTEEPALALAAGMGEGRRKERDVSLRWRKTARRSA